MNARAKVVLNESHKLLPDQERLLNEQLLDGWELLPVPADGWDLEQQLQLVDKLRTETAPVVLASPVPVLLGKLVSSRAARREALLAEAWSPRCSEHRASELTKALPGPVLVLHNDARVAREVPDGKGGVRVVHTVAPDGWQLVTVS
jgi:hypothetical protein